MWSAVTEVALAHLPLEVGQPEAQHVDLLAHVLALQVLVPEQVRVAGCKTNGKHIVFVCSNNNNTA
jgi:hypothetical protein